MSAASNFSVFRQQYPDPFLDIASTKLPKSQKKLLELLFIFSTQHPQISPIVKKLAKYPITNVVINLESNQPASLEKKWIEILEEVLNIYEVAEEMGLDYMAYGNCFITVHKPFIRSYQCKGCGFEHPAGTLTYYITGKKFYGTCKQCKKSSQFEGKDLPTSAVEEVSIVRVPPQDMHVRYNELTGKTLFFRTVPADLKQAVGKNKPDRELIDTTPWAYIVAAMNNKKIKFGKGKILHLKEPSPSSRNMHWGTPIIMAALKDAYLNQVFKKADETIANERAVPARFVFPQATSQDPFRAIALSKFSSFIGDSMRRFRHDKNAIMPVPFPVGVAEIGGDAQRLFTSNVRELTIREIIGATGVPEGFLSDGMTWSGGSVQLRMLENALMSYVRALNKLLSFVCKEVGRIAELPVVSAKFKPFRMADDVQMLQMLLQLAQMKHVSFKEILDRMDLSWEDQHELVEKETEKVQKLTIIEALTEAKAALESVKWQVESQSRASSSEEMLKELNSHKDSTISHLTRQATYDEADQQNAEQMQEQQQQEGQQGEIQMRQEEAKAMTDESMAMKRQAETTDEEAKYAPLINGLIQKLLAMAPAQREKKLEELKASAPTLSEKVEQGLQAAMTQGESQEEDSSLLAELRAQSRNPKEMAERITMLSPQLKSQAFTELQQQDPQLAIAVAQEMNLAKSGRGGSRSRSGVDSRPNPEQRPPRRK